MVALVLPGVPVTEPGAPGTVGPVVSGSAEIATPPCVETTAAAGPTVAGAEGAGGGAGDEDDGDVADEVAPPVPCATGTAASALAVPKFVVAIIPTEAMGGLPPCRKRTDVHVPQTTASSTTAPFAA
jgi:hypothetical protein